MKKKIGVFLTSLIVLLLVSCGTTKKEEYKVSFETFGGEYIQNQNVLEGSLVERPVNDPKKPGYIFDDWYLDEQFNTKWEFLENTIDKDTTIYAKFEKDVEEVYYEVVFKDEAGTVISSKKYVENTLIKKPSDPLKDNYIFLGWYLGEVKFDFNTNITENIILVSKFKAKETYTIELITNGGELFETEINVLENEKFDLPIPTHPLGHKFLGWFDHNDNLFESETINSNIKLYAKYLNENNENISYQYGSYPEAIWIEIDGVFDNVEVFYNESSTDNLVKIDQELVRNIDGLVLIDIVGLKAGYYNVKVILNLEIELNINQIHVKNHDRSGYAHFNYSEGIGAYNDDGTLKDDAVVVYVTDENKDLIKIDGINQTGLGFILNNAQYNSNKSNTYNPSEYQKSLAYFNRPIVFRIIGKITAPQGVTAYDSTDYGGSLKDNGNMVRIRDANNITVEGIGQDAIIYGWGIHFIAASNNRGIGFEVRNITFDKYPEDALGLEGVQSNNVLSVPVQRGWIHNNTFKQGYHPNPAESDKAFGDGSLDVKRGMYFTISYNHFVNARKTNLIGAGDNNLQYHFTYHHNLWLNSDSRTPLSRTANVHLYNNVFMTSDDNEGSISYAVNSRANSYIFSEANYFHAIKNPFRISHSGGPIKSYNDVLYSTYNEHHQTIVDFRDTPVPSNNKYENFDTDETVFYYDSVNKKSNVSHMTDAVTAKMEVLTSSGTYKKSQTINEKDYYITNIEAEVITDKVNGEGGKILKGIPYYVFKVQTRANFSMVDGSGSVASRLVDIFGRPMLTGTGSITLEPGIYVIESSISHGTSKGVSQAKEAQIISFEIEVDKKEASEIRINNYNDALKNLPSLITYDETTLNLINIALDYYNDLTEEEKSKVNYNTLNNAKNSYYNLGKTYIEALINEIGVVNETSYTKISNARNSYDNALEEVKKMITNYQILEDAENTYKQFEITNLINIIDNLDFSNLNILNKDEVFTSYNDIRLIEKRYNNLSETDQALITNFNKLNTNLETFSEIISVYNLKDDLKLINNVEDNLDKILSLYQIYEETNIVYLEILTQEEINTLLEYYQQYLDIVSRRKEELYYYGNNNNYFTLENLNSANNLDNNPYQYNDEILITKGTKIESKTKIIFSAQSNFRIEILFITGTSIKLNDQVYSVLDNKITLDLNAGTYEITRDKSEARFVYILITENF